MRRLSASIALGVLMVCGLIVLGQVSGSVHAQEATPVDEEGVPEGSSVEFLTLSELPPDMEPPAEITMFRLTLERGFALPFSAEDPSASHVLIESGTLTFTTDKAVTVRRAAAEGEMFPEVTEDIAPGTEFMMTAGDSTLLPPHLSGEVRSDGTVTALILVAQLTPAGAFEHEEGTPEP